ncbi:MAG: SIS domain-containing protein [Gemmatimonadetes bacterium]|nr:SIS domain-containing protein [Gemmatimonadota bacterium]
MVSEPVEALYPFLGDGATDPEPVLADVRQSTLKKRDDVVALRRATWERHADDLVRAARIVARAAARGGKVLTFGNGGSATDARDLAADLADPPLAGQRGIPALDLTRQISTVTAVANDVGFERVFVRQVIAFGNAGDVAIGFSTSGESGNVVAALETAKERGLATIGFAGDEGGRMAEPGFLDVCVVAPSAYVPRIQEAHATAYHAMVEMAQAALAEEGA